MRANVSASKYFEEHLRDCCLAVSSFSREREAMTGKNEETVVAVVLADGFGDQFGPLVDDRPQCLLPVANRALIDYTLDSLTRSGVHQTIVYCTQKTATVKDHVRNRKNVTVISNVDSRSLGDAMRDLDGKAILRDHFLLVTDGGFVGNVDLGAILKNHKSRAANEDKNSAVTLVMKEAVSGNGLRTATEEVLLATTDKERSDANRVFRCRGSFSFFRETTLLKTLSFPRAVS